MSMSATLSAVEAKTPWHLWVVGAVALLWNGSGAYTIMMAQAGKLSGISAEEVAYYAAQPLWFAVTTDFGTVAAVAAAIALLSRSRTAVWLFAISLIVILCNNAYDVAGGTSRTLVNRGALIVTGIIVVLAFLELAYAAAMKKRSVLV
jgi:hypothetical protein